MFGFLNRKKREIKSPIDGRVVALESVDDDVFSQLMVGDGVAIEPVGSIFSAPIDGVVSRIFSTNHAYSIKSDKDLEVMVHIGIDTVALDGKGFERLVEQGDSVKAGDSIIRVDLDYISKNAKSIISPIILTDGSSYKSIEKRLSVVKAQDTIMEVR